MSTLPPPPFASVPPPPPCPPAVLDALSDRGAAPGPHIERLELEGGIYWIKRPERPGLRMRIQKGDPIRAFETDRQALHRLGAAGAPVPPILAEGPDWYAMPDCGGSIGLLQRVSPDAAERAEAVRLAGRALGRLHRLGFSHGRPSTKDMCLRDGVVTLIDFERFRDGLNTPRGQARDLVVFAFNVLANAAGDGPEIAAALQGYRETGPLETWPLARAWCRRMVWVDWLTKPVQMRPGRKGREFKLIPRTLALFRDA